jgi:hypothetical protein
MFRQKIPYYFILIDHSTFVLEKKKSSSANAGLP